MLANQGCECEATSSCFRKALYQIPTLERLTVFFLPDNLELYALAWLLNSPKDGMHSCTSMPSTLTRSVMYILFFTACASWSDFIHFLQLSSHMSHPTVSLWSQGDHSHVTEHRLATPAVSFPYYMYWCKDIQRDIQVYWFSRKGFKAISIAFVLISFWMGYFLQRSLGFSA